SMELTPEVVRKHLKDEQYKLYKLIWDRFVASQMAPAVYDQTTVEIEAVVKPNGVPAHKTYGLKATGRTLKFGGWLEAYGKGIDAQKQFAGEDDEEGEDKAEAKASLEESADAMLPELNQGEELSLVKPPGVIAEQKF